MLFHVGEARTITQACSLNAADMEPDSATIKITKDDTAIVDTTAAGVSGNQVYYPISSSNVTAVAGEYKFVWTILKGTSTYIHVDYIAVKDV